MINGSKVSVGVDRAWLFVLFFSVWPCDGLVTSPWCTTPLRMEGWMESAQTIYICLENVSVPVLCLQEKKKKNRAHTPALSVAAICICRTRALRVSVIDGPVSTVKVIASVLTSLQQLRLRSSPLRLLPSITDICSLLPHCPDYDQHTHSCQPCPLNSLMHYTEHLRIRSLTVS